MPPPATRPAWAAAASDLATRHPVLSDLHDRHGPPRLGRGPAPDARFEALASSIAYQQLAGRAAATIWGRVVDVVGRPFTPAAVLAAGPERLRAAGLSGAKTTALLDLALKVDDGTVRLERVARWDDQAVIEHLTVVRGIGPWTAQMFLLFDLRRLDVWPVGDYGVRAGLARAHGWEEPPTEKEMVALGEPFAPYRSVVAWWCWREVDTVTPSG
jgi:DNA-3-methyladenine glycosylase II